MSNQMSAMLTGVVGGLVLLSVPMILIMTFIAANRAQRKKIAEWRQMPTLDEYLAQHPECRAEAGPVCSECRATGLYQRGLNGVTSTQRIHVCDACGAQLFRSGA